MKLLHFADAHIDMANYGRHDPESGLPLRVLDFLKSLDTIVDAAISQKVDLVIFAGDAYKDRAPAPTFQREWGKRIMRLSQAQIPTLLLVGNHDMSPATRRAHAIQEFETLQVPYVRVLSKIQFLGPDDLWGMPLQVIALPWISRSTFMADYEIVNSQDVSKEVYGALQDRVEERIMELIEQSDSSLPLILTAHASIEGAKFGGERLVMLGSDFVLSGSLVKNTRFSYVAMGHIHKPQDVNHGQYPPVIYPGSIERIDFGEANEERCYVLADIEKGRETSFNFVPIQGTRPFVEKWVLLESSENITEYLKSQLPAKLSGAIVKFVVQYPREWDALIDEAYIRKCADATFEFHFIKKPIHAKRVRIDKDQVVSSLSSIDLLDQYWKSVHAEDRNINLDDLQALAREIMAGDEETDS